MGNYPASSPTWACPSPCCASSSPSSPSSCAAPSATSAPPSTCSSASASSWPTCSSSPGWTKPRISCWLETDNGFLWSFLGPVCLIILINCTFFITTLWILRDKICSLNSDVSTVKNTRLLTFKAVAQLFILGCTWSFGLLPGKVMAYLFTIVNSLQGAFIFLVHCLLNRQVREEYKRWIQRIEKPSTRTTTFEISMSAAPLSTGIVDQKRFLNKTETESSFVQRAGPICEGQHGQEFLLVPLPLQEKNPGALSIAF
nr:adhesion G protein-coupled receptor E1-like [Pelodiscus sinensis]|eukprot:XP_014424572.2 adhesion G protein-coupled receptor E1-like [Pelodiscus sinensis]